MDKDAEAELMAAVAAFKKNGKLLSSGPDYASIYGSR